MLRIYGLLRALPFLIGFDTLILMILAYPYIILWALDQWGLVEYNFTDENPGDYYSSMLITDDLGVFINSVYDEI